MKKIVCEMCGDSDVVKENGLYVCQTCGSKFTVEEARKMMVEIEGTVNVTGKVSIDHTSEEENLNERIKICIDKFSFEDALKISQELQKIGSHNAFSIAGMAVESISRSPIDSRHISKAKNYFEEAISKCSDEDRKYIEIFFLGEFTKYAGMTVKWVADLLASKCVNVEYDYKTIQCYNTYMFIEAFKNLEYFEEYQFIDEKTKKYFTETFLNDFYKVIVNNSILIPNRILSNILDVMRHPNFNANDCEDLTFIFFNYFYALMIASTLLNDNMNPNIPHPYAEEVIQRSLLYKYTPDKAVLSTMYSNMIKSINEFENNLINLFRDSVTFYSSDFETIDGFCKEQYAEFKALSKNN